MADYSLFPFREEYISFSEEKLGFVQPGLDPVQGYKLSEAELQNYFGINKTRFGNLPKYLTIPVLDGEFQVEYWWHVKGWLYVVEPVAWVPVVIKEDTIPWSAFKTEYEKTQVEKSETKFNTSASASLTIEGGGSYFGVTASAKVESSVDFQLSKTSYVEEQIKSTLKTGDKPFHKLAIYPLLRCRIVKRQRIDYTVNNVSQEIKWTPDSYSPGYWEKRHVSWDRLRGLSKLIIHPVPMTGWAANDKVKIIPVPKFEDGVFSVTTVVQRDGWKDWSVYDVPWEDVKDGSTIELSAPNNGVAFGPMYTVAPLD